MNMTADILGLPYGYMKDEWELEDKEAERRLGFKKCHCLEVYFSNARERNRFAAAIKRAIKTRGRFIFEGGDER